VAVVIDPVAEAAFRSFLSDVGPRLERALIAAYGLEIGSEAYAEAVVVGWERWTELSSMENPAGYLFRVGQSRARPHLRWSARRDVFAASVSGPPVVDSATDPVVIDAITALGQLRREQRVAVLMVRAWGFTYAETAAVLDVSEAAVANHVRRGMALLRMKMGGAS